MPLLPRLSLPPVPLCPRRPRVSVVFPWSTCPLVTSRFRAGLVRSTSLRHLPALSRLGLLCFPLRATLPFPLHFFSLLSATSHALSTSFFAFISRVCFYPPFPSLSPRRRFRPRVFPVPLPPPALVTFFVSSSPCFSPLPRFFVFVLPVWRTPPPAIRAICYPCRPPHELLII